jgi:glycosyltransferase involved in cell wall biosynthesis
MLRLTIWMDAPSFYQNDMFRALVETGEVDLHVVFARELPDYRLQIGWKLEQRNYSNYTLRGSPAVGDAIRAARAQRDRFHVVNGIWVEPAFAAALCVLGRGRFAIYSESPDPSRPRSIPKRLLRRSFGSWVAKRAAGLLAVSRLATAYYTRMGFRQEQIYPFGYFRGGHRLQNLAERKTRPDRIEVIFVGQLIRRKGLDILLGAMRPLFALHPNLYLTVIGAGKDSAALQDRARSVGIESRVFFEGVIPSDQIQARLAAADLLVLPSRWDGWGLVVNEAFSVGAPAIVSDCCGVAELIQRGRNGYVFRSGDVEDLRNCLDEFLSRRADWEKFRTEAAATGEKISTDKIAPYLIACLKHMSGNSTERPVPPWLVEV